MRLAAVLLVLAGCGRIGFGLAGDPPGDGTPGDGSPADGLPTDGTPPDGPNPVTGLVETAIGTGDNAGVTITTPPTPTTFGNLLVAMVHWNGLATAVVSVTDSAGNLYTPIPAASSNGASTQFWYANNVLGSQTNIVTVGFSGLATRRRVIVHEYAGIIDSIDPLEGNGSGFGTSGQPSTSSIGASASSLMVASCFLTAAGASAAFTAGNGFTLQASGSTDSQTQDRIIPLASFTNATMSLAPSSSWILQFAVFARE